MIRTLQSAQPRSKINATERGVYTYGRNLKFYPFRIRFQLGSYKSSAKWRMAILLREMRSWRGGTCIRKVLRGLFHLSFSFFLFLFNRWNTRCASSLLLSRVSLSFSPFHSLRPDKESVSSDNLGPYRNSVTVRYIDAVKLVLQKECPKGSASRADKTTILHSNECTRLSQRVLSASVWV